MKKININSYKNSHKKKSILGNLYNRITNLENKFIQSDKQINFRFKNIFSTNEKSFYVKNKNKFIKKESYIIKNKNYYSTRNLILKKPNNLNTPNKPKIKLINDIYKKYPILKNYSKEIQRYKYNVNKNKKSLDLILNYK